MQKEELTALFNKYRAVFALNLQELGCMDLAAMEIMEEQNNKPVSHIRTRAKTDSGNY